MIDNRKLLAIVITLSLAGVLTLFFLSTTIEAEELAISQITDEHVGTLVKVNATVKKVRTTGETATITLIDTDNGTLEVFMYSDVYDNWQDAGRALPGARMAAEGIVNKYEDKFELVVSSAENVEVTAPATSNFVEVPQLLASPDIFDGMTVRTEGNMTDIEIVPGGMVFRLKVTDGSAYYLDCIVFDEAVEGAYLEGDRVEVVGSFGYYTNMGHWQLEIDGEQGIVMAPDNTA